MQVGRYKNKLEPTSITYQLTYLGTWVAVPTYLPLPPATDTVPVIPLGPIPYEVRLGWQSHFPVKFIPIE